jgi:hypothetical protein
MPGGEVASNTSSSQFDAKSVADYWLTEAEESLRVAEHLVEKADYSYALFFGHLESVAECRLGGRVDARGTSFCEAESVLHGAALGIRQADLGQ